MTDYLKQFIERASDVPMQLRRRLALIRDLDEKAVALHKEIDEQCRRLLAEKAQPASKKQKTAAGGEATPDYDVESALKRLVGLADEKVRIASQIYDFMDKHINQLDADLLQLDAEVEADRKELGLEEDETASEQLGIEPPKGALGRPLAGGDARKKRGKRKDGKGDEAAAAIGTIDEPAYCICQKPSAGEMVGCDNPDCTIEWFHLECVGLTSAPAGKWYCPNCREQFELKPGKRQGKKG